MFDLFLLVKVLGQPRFFFLVCFVRTQTDFVYIYDLVVFCLLSFSFCIDQLRLTFTFSALSGFT